mmetsp:Transcript_75535/g.167162  ORF Transcript_75535/g.167162 Transcript_75535/m.167162 type:complete len:270 (-) Transcript_75535:188-997(-)
MDEVRALRGKVPIVAFRNSERTSRGDVIEHALRLIEPPVLSVVNPLTLRRGFQRKLDEHLGMKPGGIEFVGDHQLRFDGGSTDRFALHRVHRDRNDLQGQDLVGPWQCVGDVKRLCEKLGPGLPDLFDGVREDEAEVLTRDISRGHLRMLLPGVIRARPSSLGQLFELRIGHIPDQLHLRSVLADYERQTRGTGPECRVIHGLALLLSLYALRWPCALTLGFRLRQYFTGKLDTDPALGRPFSRFHFIVKPITFQFYLLDNCTCGDALI